MPGLPASPFVYTITDRKLAGEPGISVIVQELCRGGAGLIQIREKNITTARFCQIACDAVAVARPYGVPVLINDRVDVARYAKADGVHLGDDELPAEEARAILGPEKIIGISCHSLTDVKEALKKPLDYIAVGPVYPTTTKKLKYSVAGLELVSAARKISHLPLVAIGGISSANAAAVINAGANSISVISQVMVKGEIAKRTASLLTSICNS